MVSGGPYLTQGLHRMRQQQPTAPATIFGDRVRTVTEHADRVARTAGALHALGVRRGDRVAILAHNSDRYAELLLAVPWADAVLVPVNTRWSAAEVGYALADSGAALLFVDDHLAPLARELPQPAPPLVHMGEAGPPPEGMLAMEALLAAAQPVEDARRGGDDAAGIFYTGGTTGTPKGVVLSHANLLASALGSAATGHLIQAGDRPLHVAPLFHVGGLTLWVLATVAGCPHVIVPGFQPEGVLDAIDRHRITATFLVPTMVQLLLDHPSFADHDLGSLRHVIYGASPMAQATLEQALKTLPQAGFTQAYGMTELSPVATLLGPDEHTPVLLRSAGRAAPHAEVKIVDPAGDPVPTGTVGEVAVRGPGVMLGYWNRPAETAAALRDGWMHTGDAGYLDENGYLFVVDRIKDMIITGAENVYSAEVENAVTSHPAVASCAVIGLPDPHWGERVHAVVVLHSGALATAEEIRAHVRTLIAGYKVPRSVEFVDALPLTAAGKLLKSKLRASRAGTPATRPPQL